MRNPDISHIAIIAGGYPSPGRPISGTFVREITRAMARRGIRCTVIQPIAIHKDITRKSFPYHETEEISGNEGIHIYRPRFLSFSARSSFRQFGMFNPGLFTLRGFVGAVRRVLKRMDVLPDAIYGHFLYLAGAAAVQAGRSMGIPAFAGIGESVNPDVKSLWTIEKYGLERAKALFSAAHGLICNSSLLKEILADQLGVSEDRIGMFPNGFNPAVIYQRDRREMREKYGFSSNRTLAACTGGFSERKGQRRIVEAACGMDDMDLVFIGGGVPEVAEVNIVYNSAVPHDKVPELLSACDMFVLPTLGEGSSNAIVEAMACGLPVISSNGAFNDDLLTDDMSIRVDPLDIRQIREAIRTLCDNSELRDQMSKVASERSAQFDINERIKRIIGFMRDKMKE